MRKEILGITLCSLFLAGCADLVITSVHDAPLTGAGLRMMKATVKNDGLRAAPESRTRLEVKTPTSAFAEKANMPTPALGRGEQRDLDLWPFNMFQEIPAGQCIEARVCADSGNTVQEGWLGGESNNCRTTPICRNQ